MKQNLFVYGTLIKEFAPSEIAETVAKLKYVGEGFVYGSLYDLGEYPGAILSGLPKSKIFGRVYQIPSNTDVLQKLDSYEGFYSLDSLNNLFVRKETIISLINGKKIKGWFYEYNGSVNSSNLIKSGDYSKVAA